MAQELKSINLVAPAFKGVNTEDSPLAQDPSFAEIADNAVIDKRGRIAARKGHAVVTTNKTVLGTDSLYGIKEYRDVEVVIWPPCITPEGNGVVGPVSAVFPRVTSANSGPSASARRDDFIIATPCGAIANERKELGIHRNRDDVASRNEAPRRWIYGYIRHFLDPIMPMWVISSNADYFESSDIAPASPRRRLHHIDVCFCPGWTGRAIEPNKDLISIAYVCAHNLRAQ